MLGCKAAKLLAAPGDTGTVRAPKVNTFSRPLTLPTTRRRELVPGTDSRLCTLSQKCQTYLLETSCATNTPVATRSGLRCGKLPPPRWNLSGCFFSDLLCTCKRSCSRRPSSTLQSPTMVHHLRCTTFRPVSKCSPIPIETRQQIWQSSGCLTHTAKWSDFDVSPACCVCWPFCAKQGVPTARDQPCASLLWQAPTWQSFFCSLDVTPKCILACASLDTKYDDPPVSCWQTWIPVTPKSSAVLATLPILLARVQAQLTVKRVNQLRADCQLKFVTPWYKR